MNDMGDLYIGGEEVHEETPSVVLVGTETI